MAIAGLGFDLVDIDRAERILERHGDRALDRFLLPAERAYVVSGPAPPRHFAVRVAAKEAVYKALSRVPGGERVTWRDIEVHRAPNGRPTVRLHGRALEVASRLGDYRLHLTLTHTAKTAGAMAVLESESSISD